MRPSCPRCKEQSPYKNGHALGRQRWRCRYCAYAFTVPWLRHKPAEILFKTLEMYEMGLSSNRIALYLKMSPTTVLKWIRLLSPSNGRIYQKARRAVYSPEVTEAFRLCRQRRADLADCQRYAERLGPIVPKHSGVESIGKLG